MHWDAKVYPCIGLMDVFPAKGRRPVNDVAAVAVLVGLFVGSFLYLRACERL
jgi:hypothetical protein